PLIWLGERASIVEEPPDLSPPIGRRFVIPEHAPVMSVKRYFLPKLVADVRAIIKSVEKTAKRRGKPPDLAAHRRNGKWYFLYETRRADAEALATPYHKDRCDEPRKGHGG